MSSIFNKKSNEERTVVKMKSFSSWLLVMFMAMFWVFRILVTLQAQYDKDFGGFIAFNFNVEVALLFIAILCMVLFLRRVLIGSVVYLISYGYYFGGYIFTSAIPSLTSGETLSMSVLQNTMVAAIALILALFAFSDVLIEKVRKKDPKDKKSDWFYKNSQYDRNLDERADKNEYRNY